MNTAQEHKFDQVLCKESVTRPGLILMRMQCTCGKKGLVWVKTMADVNRQFEWHLDPTRPGA